MRRYSLIFMFIGIGLLLTACGSDGLYSIQLVLEGQHTQDPPYSFPGELIMLDGMVVINEGARIEGSAYLFGGSLELAGEVQGDIVLVNGTLVFEDTALVGGEVRLAGGTIDADPAARVSGQVVEGIRLPTDLVGGETSASSRIVRWFVQTAIIVSVAYMLGKWKPVLLERNTRAIKSGVIVCLAVGALASVVWLVLVVQMAFTIVLIPISIILTGLLFLLIIYGWVILGSLLGEQIARRLPWRLSKLQFLTLGTFLFLLFLELVRLIPLVGDGLAILISLVAFGALLLTRLGLVEFVPLPDKQLL